MQREFTQQLIEARSQQGNGNTPAGPPISDDEVWTQTVDGGYKGRIYGMGTFYSRSYSLDSVSKVGPARIDPESICDQVHALNESVKR